ncbi:MAG: methyltransferase domain-containing protein [Eubacterium sp.]
MQTYEQVDNYMKELGLRYFKGSNEFITHLALKTDKQYATEVAELLNSRAQGLNSNNQIFYEVKNKSLTGSLCISAAFDSGLFRHLGNMIIDESELFKGTVLDIGCDCGIVTCFIAQQYPESRVVGVDCNELAVNNARELAQRLGLTNVEFKTADIYEYISDEKADTATSFRGLLDIAQQQTKGVSVIGERSAREGAYEQAFLPLAKAIGANLKDGGKFVSVERYTAMYGWLGWLQALADAGICGIPEKCDRMVAQDISAPRDYSVTFASKGEGAEPLDVYHSVLVKKFKSGAGCDGADAEFALYEDSEEITFTDVYKGEKLIHQFAKAKSLSDKYMYYEADLDYRKIKYVNEKKKEKLDRDFDSKLKMYDADTFEIKTYTIVAQ